jgi:hypothetical protein
MRRDFFPVGGSIDDVTCSLSQWRPLWRLDMHAPSAPGGDAPALADLFMPEADYVDFSAPPGRHIAWHRLAARP